MLQRHLVNKNDHKTWSALTKLYKKNQKNVIIENFDTSDGSN